MKIGQLDNSHKLAAPAADARKAGATPSSNEQKASPVEAREGGAHRAGHPRRQVRSQRRRDCRQADCAHA
jgi:hypothetical protein